MERALNKEIWAEMVRETLSQRQGPGGLGPERLEEDFANRYPSPEKVYADRRLEKVMEPALFNEAMCFVWELDPTRELYKNLCIQFGMWCGRDPSRPNLTPHEARHAAEQVLASAKKTLALIKYFERDTALVGVDKPWCCGDLERVVSEYQRWLSFDRESAWFKGPWWLVAVMMAWQLSFGRLPLSRTGPMNEVLCRFSLAAGDEQTVFERTISYNRPKIVYEAMFLEDPGHIFAQTDEEEEAFQHEFSEKYQKACNPKPRP